MTSVRRSLVLGGVLLAALLGCTGPGGGPTTADTGELPEQGPLELIVRWSGTSPGTAEMIAEVARQQERIAACMADEGFEYVPQVPTTDQVTVLEGSAPGTREFVERYGYGLWTPVTETEGAFEIETDTPPEQETYLAAMSPTERDAYVTALWGGATETFADGSAKRSGGCLLFGYDDEVTSDENLAEIRDAAVEYLTGLPDDPGFAELDARWSECMAGEGMSFAAPHRARDSFLEDLDDVFVQAGVDNVDPFSLPETIERAADEKRVALADLECRESLGYDRMHTLISHELQADYVEAHRADLDALAAALDGAD